MLSEILAANIDYMLFLQGVFMLLISLRLYHPGEGINFTRREVYLQFFAAGFFLNRILEILIFTHAGIALLQILSMLFFAISFTVLSLYSIRFISLRLRIAAYAYIFSVIIYAAALSLLRDVHSGYLTLHYLLAFPVLLLAAYSVFKKSASVTGSERTGWLIVSLSMILYAFTWLITIRSGLSVFTGSPGSVFTVYSGLMSGLQFICVAAFFTGVYIALNGGTAATAIPGVRHLFPVFLCAILAAGSGAVSWQGGVADKEMKREVLNHARGLAKAISPERAAKLTFRSEDIRNPEFKLMREQMISYGKYTELTSIYSFKLIQGRLVFGPENIPEGDPLASPPGTVYIKPHPEFITLFKEAAPGVIGPYTDEYGSFITGYSPVIDPGSGSVIMAVAVDVSAQMWRDGVVSSRLKIIALVLIAVLFLVSADMIFFMKVTVWKRSDNPLIRYFDSAVILITGAVISTLMLINFSSYEKRKAENDFRMVSDSVALVIRQNLLSVGGDLYNLAKYFQGSELVTRVEFRDFVNGVSLTPVKERVWYRRVYEPRREGLAFRLEYIESSMDSGRKKGDYLEASVPLEMIIENASESGSGSVLFYSDKQGLHDQGKLLTAILPVYKSGRIEGFLLSVSDLTLMLNYSISFSKGGDATLGAEIIDITHDIKPDRLSSFPEVYNSSMIKYKSIAYPVFLFDHVIGIKVYQLNGGDFSYVSRIGIMGGVSGLMLTLALAVFINYMRRREYTLEDLVSERTNELESANEELQSEMEEFEAMNAELIDANQQLAESEEKFSRAFSINPAIMSITSIEDGKFFEVNGSFLEITGYARDEVIGKTVYELEIYSDSAQRDIIIDFIRKDGFVRNIEVALKTSAGDVRQGLFSADFIKIKDKKYMLSVVTDITERKKIEEALKFSEKKYRLLFETAPDSIFFLENSIFIDCNRKAEETFGCSRGEILGKTPDIFSPEFQPDGSLSSLKSKEKISAARKGYPQFFEWVHCRLDGNNFDAEVSLNSFDIEDKNYIIGIVRDVSERKKFELRLAHMQKMDAIGQLAGGVAHDFNNQLSGILGYAEILAMKLKGDNLKKYAEGIISSAMRSADLTKKLLAFARKGQFQVAIIDMHNLIEETVEMLRHSIDKRITVESRLNAESPSVLGDAAQLQNALLNLGLNARDAMSDGGTLTYETEIAAFHKEAAEVRLGDFCEGNYLAVSITDTGTGMSEDVKSHLFEPFFTTKESGKGTGMGLASVYGTVKNHNGAITVYSEAGHGTTFRIYLPLAGDQKDSLYNQGDDELQDIAPQRILIIDDEEVIRNVLSELLSEMGHSVIEAANGAEGLSLYRERWREIDVVIIDMIMPEINGRDAFLAMKGINPGITGILSSGFSMEGASQPIFEDGIMGFIHKPYRKSELAKKLRTVLEIKKEKSV